MQHESPANAPSSSPSRRRRRSDNHSQPDPTSSSSSRKKRARPSASGEDNHRTLLAMAPFGGADHHASKSASVNLNLIPHTGARKIVIKNRKPSTPRDDAEIERQISTTQQRLERSLDAILAGHTPTLPYERLYRDVEEICKRGQASLVHELLQRSFKKHLERSVKPSILAHAQQSSINILSSMMTEFSQWTRRGQLVRSTFSYLDRTYFLHQGLPSINQFAIDSFCDMAFPKVQQQNEASGSIGSRAVDGMCELIQDERLSNGPVDHRLLRSAVYMFSVLGKYKKFRIEFLKQTQIYFTGFAASWSVAPLRDYVSAVKKLLEKERSRGFTYSFDSLTQNELEKKGHRILIEDQVQKFLDKGSLSAYLSDKEMPPLQGAYELLQLSGLESRLKDPWTAYVKESGKAIIGDKEHGDQMVVRLLNLRRALNLVLRDAFHQDIDFLRAMREAFSNFMNDPQIANCWSSGTSKAGEMLAKHIDTLLRGGLKALPQELLSDARDRADAEKAGRSTTADEDAELERQVESAIELFRFLEGKDAFEAFYKKDLAKRLLMGRSASSDAERLVLAKLRGECGSNFTHNLEQMFKDQDVAKDEMEMYRKRWAEDPENKPRIDLQVMILSASAWPSYADSPLQIPDEVAKELERFDTFYRAKHTGRVLSWKHSLAQCSLKSVFAKGTKELVVSSYQAVILMLFNAVATDGFLSYEQIGASTGLQDADLERSLQSLACGKSRVLTKHPKGREVNKTDTFTFNKGFTDPRFRVKINQVQLKETKEENQATHDKIVRDRRFETQAAIVRIMKSRKKMGHSELVAEVINMTKKRGSVEPAAIKKDIETLMDKDYIDREGNQYTYLA